MSEPKTVAVVGASADPTKFGNRSLLAHQACGYEVYPINPKGGEIEGAVVYRSILDAPIDRFVRVTMYVPPKVGLQLLDEIAQKGCDELWLNPGSESPEVVDRANQLGLNPIVACSLVDCQNRGHEN